MFEKKYIFYLFVTAIASLVKFQISYGQSTISLSTLVIRNIWPVERQLQTCHSGLNSSLSNNVNQLQEMMDILTEHQQYLQNLTDLSVSLQGQRQTQLSEIRATVQNKKRELSFAKTILAQKFDCQTKNFTISECSGFCKFPYAYDSCAEEAARAAQELFVTRILNQIGTGYQRHQIYISLFNSTTARVCQRTHVVNDE